MGRPKLPRTFPDPGSLRVCKRCGEQKPIELFQFRPDKCSTGYLATCKACHVRAEAKRQQAPHIREKNRLRNRKRYHENPDVKARVLAKSKERRRPSHIKRAYGLTAYDVQALIDLQCGLCAVCCEPFTSSTKANIDHDHSTGVVRGILCSRCNLGIGQFRDNPMVCISAAQYLMLNQ